VPACPTGFRASRETCVAAKPVATARTDEPAKGGTTTVEAPAPAKASAPETPRAQMRFTAPAAAPAGTRLAVQFAVPLHAREGEQFWVNVVKAGDPPSSWGRFSYLAQDARTGSIPLPNEPGAYEIRLHANYPTKKNNIVFRAPLRIDP